MDTRFWGPSGWRLLHLVAASPNCIKNTQFWKSLPFVLPCKFCRASLSEYYIQHPVPTSAKDYPKWLYTIHNCVNEKLRKQGQTIVPDPPFSQVEKHYEELLKQGCTRTSFPGWEFLFCIADNHPDSSPSSLMPDAPSDVSTRSLAERNHWNALTAKERKQTLKQFWRSLPDVLPFEEWRTSWNQHVGPLRNAILNRRSALAWLWRIRCGMDKDLQQMGEKDFFGLCKTLKQHRSGCSSSTRAKTCRAVKGGARKTRRHKQRAWTGRSRRN